ncbi:hypothetical protein L1987_49401 [Smallanthus sonchifolius]|uniref:Uncharacterized protein n=1 Tax=Smallanthus sonchifolius TaxID=185202 RepID=A0ACB9FUF6_9ASTR|nr:hypothetical protein L1987_49401 [Smallanthus sonchifolius]
MMNYYTLHDGKKRRCRFCDIQGFTWKTLLTNGETLGSLTGKTLASLYEGPDQDGSELVDSKWVGSAMGQWMKVQLSRARSMCCKPRSDLRLLLGVMGSPLASVHVCTADPLPHLCIKDAPIRLRRSQAHFLRSQQEDYNRVILFL